MTQTVAQEAEEEAKRRVLYLLLSLSLYRSASVSVSVSVSVYLTFAWMSVRPPVHLSACLSISMSACLPVQHNHLKPHFSISVVIDLSWGLPQLRPRRCWATAADVAAAAVHFWESDCEGGWMANAESRISSLSLVHACMAAGFDAVN